MNEAFIMLKNVLLFVALALPGYVLVKTKILKAEQSQTLSKLLTYVGMPFLIVTSTYDVPLNGEILWSLLAVVFGGVAYTFFVLLCSKPLTKREENPKTRGLMQFCMAFSNNGFLGIPLVIAVFGANSPVFVYYIGLNLITNTLMNTLGLYLVSQDKKVVTAKRALLSPVVIALVLGVVLNLVKAFDYFPEGGQYSGYFSAIVTPLSMTVLGMKMGGIDLKSIFLSKKAYYVASLKLFFVPVALATVLVACNLLLGLPKAIVVAGFITFAMPAPTLSSTFADGFGGDTENAVTFTLLTTLLSVVTIPLLYFLICLCIV